MRCPICSESDKWKNVDEYRIKPEGMSLCMGCGFVSYPDRYKTKDEIIKYYEDDYRTTPRSKNLFQGERKIHFHAHFLEEIIAKWKQDKRPNMVITDIGSAFGQTLHWLRGHFPEADVKGVELTKGYVRNAWHLFKIESLKEFDTSKKYDLICSYKSLEHILDPDVEMTSYIDCLKDDGYLYISVPLWFDELTNFGANGFDLEYYYSPNHINTWTRRHFEGMIARCGGEIIKDNHTYYDSTYLVKKGDKTDEIAKEDPSEIIDKMKKIREISKLLTDNKYAECLELWPKFPHAHAANYEMNRKKYHQMGFDWIQENVLKRALEDCPDNPEIRYFCADVCSRYNEFEKSIEFLQQANEMKPNVPHVFHLLGHCFRQMAEHSKSPEDKVKLYDQSRESMALLKRVSMQCRDEATNWLMFDNSKIPTPFEGLSENGSQ